MRLEDVTETSLLGDQRSCVWALGTHGSVSLLVRFNGHLQLHHPDHPWWHPPLRCD